MALGEKSRNQTVGLVLDMPNPGTKLPLPPDLLLLPGDTMCPGLITTHDPRSWGVGGPHLLRGVRGQWTQQEF
jgi:hypothetical protein